MLEVVGNWDAVIHNGKFNIRKAYSLLHGYVQKMGWRRMVCNNKASPKSKFILWFDIQNRLATTDRFSRWNVNCSLSCCLCDEANESVQHLFFECGYFAAV